MMGKANYLHQDRLEIYLDTILTGPCTGPMVAAQSNKRHNTVLVVAHTDLIYAGHTALSHVSVTHPRAHTHTNITPPA